MENLVKFIVENIVDDPESVQITREEGEEGEIKIQITVAEEDKGRVIGKSGRIINSIRNITRVLAAKQNVKVFVEVL